MVSIVVPANNEASSIARLLGGLLADAEPGEFEIIVVCNGCTDATAEIARGFGADVTVMELPEPSKAAAMTRADKQARTFPRLYVDADVEIGTADVRNLRAVLGREGILAAGPRRQIPSDGVSWLVRGYYDVWERLPQVKQGLFGRGVIALSREGHERIGGLPPMMSDDLVMSEAFTAQERVISDDAVVVVRPPRTLADLLRRRVRVSTGNAEADAAGLRQAEARTGFRTLLQILLDNPTIAPQLMIFVAVTSVARVGARCRSRAGTERTWLRDESSRG